MAAVFPEGFEDKIQEIVRLLSEAYDRYFEVAPRRLRDDVDGMLALG